MTDTLIGNRSIKLSITLVLIFALAYIVDWRVFAQVSAKLDWFLVLPVLLVQSIARLTEASQLWAVIKYIGRSVTLTRVFLSNALATFYGFILPGQVLATAPKWIVLSKDAGSRSDILNAIIYNRLALLIPPTFIGCMALGTTDILEENWLRYAFSCIGIGIILTPLFLFNAQTGPSVLGIMRWIVGKSPRPLRKSGGTFIESFAKLQELKLKEHLSVYLLSITTSLVRISALLYAAAIVSVDVPLESLALAYSVITVLAFLPLTFGNIGVREGVLIIVLGIYGVSPAESLLIGVVLFLEHIIFAVIGGLFQMRLASQSPVNFDATSETVNETSQLNGD